VAERSQIRDPDLLGADLLGEAPAVRPKRATGRAVSLPPAEEATAPAASLDRQLLALRKIVAPLLAAVMEGQRESGLNASAAEQLAPFAELIGTTVALTRDLQPQLNDDAATRWHAACGLAEIVAAHFRATAEPLPAEEGGPLIAALSEAMRGSLAELAPALAADVQADALARSYKSLAPAVAAVARFSFGRDTLELIEDITRRLTVSALEIAMRLAGVATPAEALQSPLYHAVLEVAGDFYQESHFSEMDRLLAMSPEARNDYVKEHDRKIPMEPVWESLELKLAMMEVMAAHLPSSPAGDEA
jgi:hypothetical protein